MILSVHQRFFLKKLKNNPSGYRTPLSFSLPASWRGSAASVNFHSSSFTCGFICFPFCPLFCCCFWFLTKLDPATLQMRCTYLRTFFTAGATSRQYLFTTKRIQSDHHTTKLLAAGYFSYPLRAPLFLLSPIKGVAKAFATTIESLGEEYAHHPYSTKSANKQTNKQTKKKAPL